MQRLRALGALLVLLGFVVGVPLLLAHTIGNPLHGWADLKAGDINDGVIIDVLAAITYLAWAQFALSVVVELGAAIRRAPMPTRLPFVFSCAATPGAQPGRDRPAARRGAADDHDTGPRPCGSQDPGDRTAHRRASVHDQLHRRINHTDATPTKPPLAAPTPDREPRARTSTYVVPAQGAGPDTYWDIAAATLGSGERWHEIWALNEGRTQPDGSVMTRASLLRPGWSVLLPATAAIPSSARRR